MAIFQKRWRTAGKVRRVTQHGAAPMLYVATTLSDPIPGKKFRRAGAATPSVGLLRFSAPLGEQARRACTGTAPAQGPGHGARAGGAAGRAGGRARRQKMKSGRTPRRESPPWTGFFAIMDFLSGQFQSPVVDRCVDFCGPPRGTI